jgi:hypothetical protein
MGWIMAGSMFSKKDCWKCVGTTRVKKRVLKLLPCSSAGAGWQSSQPNCGVRVVNNRPRPTTGVTVVNRPNTGITVGPNILPVNAPGWWNNSPTRPVINTTQPHPGYPPIQYPQPVVTPIIPAVPAVPDVYGCKDPAANNYNQLATLDGVPCDYTSTTTITTTPATATAGTGDNKIVMFLAIAALGVWYVTKK